MPLPVKNYPRSKLLPGLPTSMQFYTIPEVAIILETNVGVVRDWIKSGLLPSVQFGVEQHMESVRAQDLEKFIDINLRSGLIKPDGPKVSGNK